ncbi:MAG: type II toxin-antitoxin system RelE/ParE family toxin [Candidatus Coatesbacteria bacterium]
MDARYEVVFYLSSRGDSPPKEFVDRLEKRVRAKVYKWLDLLAEEGPDLPRPHADVVDGPIRELRVGFGRLEVRLLYFFHARTLIVVAHGFLKKARAIPDGELRKAHRAHADWLIRYGGSK